MKTVIYYFTGTGNTLAVARSLGQEISRDPGDTELIAIPPLMKQDAIITDADAVGIAFPVYFQDMPGIVKEFVRKLRFGNQPYIFGIATFGMMPGGALFRLSEILEENGYRLSAGYALVMPENFLGPISLMESNAVQEKKNAEVRRRIPEIASAIRGREVSRPEGSASAVMKFGSRLMIALQIGLYDIPGRLHATAACNRCGTCARICPAQNITVEKEGVRWQGNCTWCYACIHWCPQHAVEIGGRTAGIPRYHHPDVTLADMLRQRGDV